MMFNNQKTSLKYLTKFLSIGCFIGHILITGQHTKRLLKKKKINNKKKKILDYIT